MSSSKIRLGFVGLGYITGAHLRGLKLLRDHGFDNFEVTALCSRNRDNAERWIERGKGPAPLPAVSAWPDDPLNVRDVWVRDFQSAAPRVYTDHRSMLADRAVDAVVILSAVSAHHVVAGDALDAGVHAFVEKPFTLTARAALRLIEKAEARRLTLGVAENLRYFESTRAAAWAVRANLLGAIQMVLSGGVGNVWSPDAIVARTPWRHIKREAGGGGTMDIGAHLFDRLRYVCGEIEEVFAFARTLEPLRVTRDEAGKVIEQVQCDADDTFFALLQFASGAIGNVVFSWAGRGPHTHFEAGGALYGSRGCLKGDQLILDGQPPADVTARFYADADPALRERLFPHRITDCFALELLEFLRAIEQGRQPETSGVEGLKDMAPGLAILESSTLGRPVKVADVEAGRVETYQESINEYWGIR
ncbi:MAG: Gfo/Idh/MocA family oxidoreductase [Anaerolineae bacterium]|nr:Gfo/Idh/MocA family oxidoreductase [Thermoflexales bacterium]MDW8407689.1 Gfo/Idh/MocA family oxidoreductase [Anaerolineae bacterium]